MKDKEKINEKLLKEIKTLQRQTKELEKLKFETKQVDETLLRESEGRLDNVLKTIREGVTFSDKTGHFYIYNSAMEKLTGYSIEEANACSDFTRLLYPRQEDWQRAFEGIAELLEKGTSRETEMTILAKDGQSKSILIWSSLIWYKGREMFLSVYRDITERKRAEDDLKNSEYRLKILFEYAPDAIYLNDLAGTIIDGNKAAEKLTGYEREELIGENFLKLNLLSMDQITEMAALLAKNALGKPTGPDEFVLNRKNGTQVVMEIRTFPVKIKDKVLVLAIARDITERREIEKTRQLAQLGRLVTDMAHEVNSPLMVISGNAQLALMEEIQSKELKNNLKIIIEECQRAKDIIQRLLKFSRPSKGVLKDTDINESIETVVGIVTHQFNLAGIEIKRKLAQDLPFMLVDEKQIQEVFMNLLNNAKDAMSKDGIIEITTSLEKDSMRIDFKDTGCGMSEEVKKRLFEPFFTTKENGTGLGLSVCYGIIKAHNGELKFKSATGKGSIVTIILPLKEK